MKTQILKSILVLAMMFFTLPMVAQDYLTIYLKNGHEERHLLSLVKNISSSKYDLDGTLHSDYQIQQVCMEDTIISYLIEDIDSVSFRKVNVEQVAEDVENVVSTINTILDNSSSPDFQDIANEVANMDGVEEVELDDDALIIKIKDWRNIIYYKTPNLAGPTENMMARSISPLIRKSKSAAAVNNSVKVAITNQFINDEERDIVDEKNNELVNDFKSLGYDVDYITDVNFDFLYSKMFEYDVVMLETHGKFALGRHWLLTNYEIDESVLGGLGGLIHTIKDGLAYFKDDIDDVSYYCIDETRNGKKKWIYYAAVSEDYISKSISKFNNGAIIFASVCSSIKTTQDLANLYFKKGASVYLGYDDEAYYGWTVGPNYFRDMLYGKSAIKAYHNIPEYYRVESNTREKAKLQILTKDKDNESLFITKTVTAPSTEIKDEILDNGSHQITITGYTSSLGTEILCGLEISEDPNMKDVQSDFRTMKEVDSPNGNYTFEMSLTAPSGITLYYRAYSYDGENYNYGEICSYIIPDNLQISTTLLSLKVRETSTIQIIAGSGQYGVTNLNSEIAIATLQGTTISINGVSMGKAQVVVTDILTGQKAIIEITVKDPNSGNHEYVDLGLPSGTLWATCNVGACTPEEFGDYFAWGEVEPKEAYSWNSYKYCNGSEDTMTKYCTDSSYGTVDNKTELEPEDDAASANWGKYWQMPNTKQQEELIDEKYTTTEWTTINGVYGRKITSKSNGNWIFLPASGYYSSLQYDTNKSGDYWSRSLGTKYTNQSRYLFFNSEKLYYNYIERRFYGQSVRPVLSSAATLSVSQKTISMDVGGKKTVEITSGSGSYSVESSNEAVVTAKLRGNYIDIYGVTPGNATITVTDVPTNLRKDITVTVREPDANFCKDPNHPHMIDLGLPSGTKWACCNIGADIPEGYGNYFAWGETEPKDWYGYDTYIHCDGTKETCHDIGAEISGTQYDVAHVKWQGSWQMPTSAQIDELTHNCQHEMITLNDVVGMLVTGPNGNKLFLPAAGFMSGRTLYHPGEYGLYKSGSRCDDDLAESWVLNADASGFVRIGIWNITGHTVRPVISGLELSTTGPLNIWVGKTEVFSVKTGSGSYSVNSSNSSVATASIVGKTVSVQALSIGTATITVTDNRTGQTAAIKVTVKDPNQPEIHEFVDLGLPSGILWATCNVGASSPEEYGNYYAWGEIKTKNVYNWESYTHSNGDSDECTDLGDISGTKYDVAHVEWGDDWRIPTYSECRELIDNCTTEWTSVGGVLGRKIIGVNGNSIFLPAGGDIIDDKYDSQGSYGWYWTSHQFSGENVRYAHSIVFNQSIISLNGYVRLIGNLIRPVRKQ